MFFLKAVFEPLSNTFAYLFKKKSCEITHNSNKDKIFISANVTVYRECHLHILFLGGAGGQPV